MVVPFPRVYPGYLDLSNTLQAAGPLSFAKPPHATSSFPAFRSVLDGKDAPGPGNWEEPFRVPFFLLFSAGNSAGAGSYLWSGSYLTPLPGALIPACFIIKLLLLPAGNRLQEPVKSRIPPTTAGSGSFPFHGRIRLFPSVGLNPLGPVGLFLPVPACSEAQTAQRSDIMGIIATIPLGEKSRENPYITG